MNAPAVIVPGNRLLLCVALVAIPCGLVSTMHGWAWPAVWVATVFAAVAVGDGLAGRRCLTGMRLREPGLQRWAKRQWVDLDVALLSESRTYVRLRVGLALPEEIYAPAGEQMLAVPDAGVWVRTHWRCLPLKRGRYALSVCVLECGSPLGLWDVRARLAMDTEIRVYPNLRDDRRQAMSVFLPRRGLGLRKWRQVGKGREFERLREYMAGDSYEDIHWKATAKHRYPITKIFQIERTQEIYVCIDLSRLSARPVPDPESLPDEPRVSMSLLDRYMIAALLLEKVAERQGDLFGLLSFDHRVNHFLRAGLGRTHFNACREALYTLQPRMVSPDFEEVCAAIRTHLRKRALVVFLTSLDDPVLADAFIRGIESIRKQHLVMVMMPRPPLAAPLFSASVVDEVDDIHRRLGGHIQWCKLEEVRRRLHHHGVRLEQVAQDAMTATLVDRYMDIKQRQAL